MYVYWVCAANETPIFSHEFPFRSISFSQITQKSVPEHHHFTFRLADFAVPETIIFKISLISTRSSPPTAAAQRVRQRRGQRPFRRFAFSSVRQRRGLAAVPEISIFKRSAAPRVSGRSGAPHFHAQNGSSSFRSPPFLSSKRLKLVPETPIFTLDRELVPQPLPFFHFAVAHTYQNLG